MSGGGGGIIIIKNSMKAALADPLVSGIMPAHLAPSVQALCAKDVNDWTHDEFNFALRCFNYAAMHC